MKRTLSIFSALSLMAVSAPAFAANSDSHSVTVTVMAINEIGVSGGAVSLTINSATAGGQPDDASDSSTADLDWTTNEDNKKVTVETDLASPAFGLSVSAGGVAGGTAAGSVALSTTPQDFVTGISATVGGCDLEYMASATAADGVGADAHVVTYTVVDE